MAVLQIVSKERARSKSPLERLAQAMDIARLGASVGGQIQDWTKLASLSGGTEVSPMQYAQYRAELAKNNLGNYAEQFGDYAKRKGIP